MPPIISLPIPSERLCHKVEQTLGIRECDSIKGHCLGFQLPRGPSLRCAYPAPLQAGEFRENKGFVCHVAVMNIVGSLMANEIIKVILGHDTELSGNLLTFDLKNNSIDFIKVKRNPLNFQQD